MSDSTWNLCGRCVSGETTAPQGRLPARIERVARRLGNILPSRPPRARPVEAARQDQSDDDFVRRWLRRMLTADANQRAVMTFDSWHNPRMSLEVITDELGNLVTTHRRVVLEALRIIESGDTLMVQVCSAQGGDEAPSESESTTRVWIFDRGGARAVDAETLQGNLLPEERSARAACGARFETGWVLSGEPGGAVARAARVAERHRAAWSR
ncbi:hypothetical protein GY21_17490 [Cryobacterium roopkundense]|uniref:Uncharacterized protein n=1 Tax=Cryobacterium roopkundense TaxID=1001240 RepID=A0A099J143_9MICO|nr:hypothetical protein [Cryobacterium roopkundense]KGJ72124.1 hypothetical protein GY21_17490 [Cryobacterium roopkundense]MBB5640692.1 hypothetical protein [Cryobacterium roopkundense]